MPPPALAASYEYPPLPAPPGKHDDKPVVLSGEVRARCLNLHARSAPITTQHATSGEKRIGELALFSSVVLAPNPAQGDAPAGGKRKRGTGGVAEGGDADGACLLYAGGPVWAQDIKLDSEDGRKEGGGAWLALAVLPIGSEETAMGGRYAGVGLIQVWRIPPSRAAASGRDSAPRVAVVLAVESVAVHALAWFRGGQASAGRVGMLAAARGDGAVSLYAVPEVEGGEGGAGVVVMRVRAVEEMMLRQGADDKEIRSPSAPHHIPLYSPLCGGV